MATLQDRLRATGWIERVGSVIITFDKVGTYRYTCSLHAQQMSGQVDVVAR